MYNIKIKEIIIDDTAVDDNGMGIVMFVYFDNYTHISFMLDSKAGDPLLHDVMLDKGGAYEIDGDRIVWQNGAVLTIGEMLAMVMSTAGVVES